MISKLDYFECRVIFVKKINTNFVIQYGRALKIFRHVEYQMNDAKVYFYISIYKWGLDLEYVSKK